MNTLEAYHFYEREWDSYDQLRDEFEWVVPDTFNIAHYFCDRWADDPDRVAIYAEDEDGTERTYTYAELRDRTNQLANYLASQGIGKGNNVGVVSPQRPETLISYLAVWKTGAAVVPLSALFGPDALEYRLSDSRATACIVTGENVEGLREVKGGLDHLETVVTVDVEPDDDEDAFWDELEAHSTSFDVFDTDSEDRAVILYTSGTTGDPKGVVHAHRFVLGVLPWFVTTVCNNDIREDDVYWTPTEWAWIAFFTTPFPGMFYGKPIVAYDGGEFDPADALQIVDKYDVSNLLLTPTIIRLMQGLDVDPAKKWDLSSTRCVWNAGEEPTESILEFVRETFENAAVHIGYGQTEAVFAGSCEALFETSAGKMGKAPLGYEVAILDPDDPSTTLPPGETGEIALRYDDNPVCFVEYWEKPEKTAAKVHGDWLRSEDLGAIDEDGHLSFVGRKDDVIISSGYKIGPEEVEDSIATHDAVVDAGTIGVPDEQRTEIPKAFVVLADGYEPSNELKTELQQHVKNRLAKYEYPREIEFIDELPRTVTGKIQRYELRVTEGIEE